MSEGYDVVRGYGPDKRLALFNAEIELPHECFRNYESLRVKEREFRSEGLSAGTFWEVTIFYKLRSAEPSEREMIREERRIPF